MTLKQIFKIKFILIIKYLPVIGKSHLPPRYSINIFVYILKEYWGLVTDFWLGCIALCLTWPVLRYWGGGFPVKIPDKLIPFEKEKAIR